MSIDISKLLDSFTLNKDEAFCLYLYRDDGYDSFGYVNTYRTADELATALARSAKVPDIHGVWITIESYDGSIDRTVLKVLEGRKCYA